MTMLDDAARRTDQADLVILNHVEAIRDQQQPATASAVASMIGGAPIRAIGERLAHLRRMQLVEFSAEVLSNQLTTFGAELLRRELVGWTPSEREERRREAQLARALASPRSR